MSTDKDTFVPNGRGIDEEAVVVQPTRFVGSSRFALCLSLLVGMALFYACRVDMSVAILCMVNHTALSLEDRGENGTNETSGVPAINPNCIRDSGGVNGTKSEDGPYLWGSFEQNHILGAFFFGYPILQIPGGWAAGFFGGRWIVFSSLLCLGLATLLVPFLTGHWIIVAIVRVLQGLASGAVFPAAHAIVSQWAPPLERSKITTIAYAGCQLGNVFTFPVSGLLCRYMNWESVFYFWGGLTLLWLVLWWFFGYNKPADHPRIDPLEKRYIKDAIGGALGDTKVNICRVPWFQFLKSPAVWGILLANFTSDWGAYTFMTQTPRYMKTVHHFDITSNASMSALPYIGYWLVISLSGPLADMLRERNWLSTVWTRRVFAIGGFLLPSACLIVLGYLHCEYWLLALILLILIVSLSGLQYASWVVSHVDIAPKYAGILYGICNSISCASGIMTSAIAAEVMSKNPTLEEWRFVFFITAAVMVFGCSIYCIAIRADIQPWAIDEAPGEKKVELVPLNGAETSLDKKD